MAVSGVCATLGTKSIPKAEAAIEKALREYAVVPLGGGYQPRGAAFMKTVIADRFRNMLSGAATRQDSLFSRSYKTIAAEATNSFESSQGISLNTEQKAAVEMALSSRLSVLTGGAGVGKTTVLRIVNEACERSAVAVIQMALSGRAAQRMRGATGRDASTIAKFLQMARDGKIGQQGERLVIIDECSMLDLPLVYNIIRVLSEHARLLLVGDPYQLPPIGFGFIFQILAIAQCS